jgi:uncharacterized membrane protein
MPAAARAQGERISFFDSHIQIAADGTLTVREMIHVHATGDTIRHGIYRDFPTLYRQTGGLRRTVPLNVREVLQDGKPQAYALEELDDGVRIRIGQKDRLLKPGDHTYTIVYTTARQIGFFKDHDELYWNVTGNGWQWPITRAGAQVTLPQKVPADRMRLLAYTGPAGAKGNNCQWRIGQRDEALFRTTRPLGAHEGLTLVVEFPKGIVQPPSLAQQRLSLLKDNADLLAGAIGLVLVLLYYLYAWNKVGRDPPGRTIVTKFEPPKDISPAGARYLWRMGFDDKCLAAALIDMAVKGYCTIEQPQEKHLFGTAPGKYILMRTDADAPDLTSAESAAATALFDGASQVRLDVSQKSRLQAGQSALKKELSRQFEGSHFNTHFASLVWGVLMSLTTLAAVVLLQPLPHQRYMAMFMMIWLSIWSMAVAALFIQFVQRVRRGGLGWILPGIMFVLFGGFEIGGLWMLSGMTSVWVAILPILLVAITVLFQYLLKAPTPLGQGVMDELAGFRQYLESKTSPTTTPAYTPQLFEQYLPYALALGVEEQWAGQFADQLSAAANASTGRYRPLWYSGNSWNTLGAAGFASSLGNSFCGALSSASSSSGSSGSSGGGGGGGGGGGW